MVSSPLAVAEDALTPSSPHTFSLFSLPTGAPGAHPPAPASCPLPAPRCPYRLVALGWDSCCRMRLNCLFIILRVRRRPGEPFFFFSPLGCPCSAPLAHAWHGTPAAPWAPRSHHTSCCCPSPSLPPRSFLLPSFPLSLFARPLPRPSLGMPCLLSLPLPRAPFLSRSLSFAQLPPSSSSSSSGRPSLRIR